MLILRKKKWPSTFEQKKKVLHARKKSHRGHVIIARQINTLKSPSSGWDDGKGWRRGKQQIIRLILTGWSCSLYTVVDYSKTLRPIWQRVDEFFMEIRRRAGEEERARCIHVGNFQFRRNDTSNAQIRVHRGTKCLPFWHESHRASPSRAFLRRSIKKQLVANRNSLVSTKCINQLGRYSHKPDKGFWKFAFARGVTCCCKVYASR